MAIAAQEVQARPISAYVLQDPDNTLWLVSSEYMAGLPEGAQPTVRTTIHGGVLVEMAEYLDSDTPLPECYA